MNVAAHVPFLKSPPAWLLWLRRELIPFPGRLPMTIRMTVSVALVTLISMALQVPQLGFSAFFTLFVTKENRVLTLVSGVVMATGVTLATIITMSLYTYTFDYPEMRVPIMAALIFTGMFLSRTFVIGPLGFVVGFFSALMQTVTESSPNTDALVRGQLWLWAAVVYPIVLSVIVNQVLLPADPWTALVQSLTLRLNAAAKALTRVVRERSAGGQTNQPLLDLATRGCGVMLGILGFAEKKDTEIKRRHPLLVETIAAAGHLVTATASLEFRDPQSISDEDLHCAKSLISDIEQLKSVVPERSPVVTARVTPRQATLPQLRELQFAVESFRDSLIRGASDYSSTNPAKPKLSLFRADAFTNPSHTRFALKVTLAAMICYVVYSGTDWAGISTSFVTCCFVALGNTGATIYKSWLRLFGCLAGGTLGYLVIFFAIPYMESITSLVLLTAIVTMLFGWVAAGSERIAYAGLQAAFAFYLCVYQGFEPGTNLTIVRDRVAGIFLGTVVSALVFRFVWPEHASKDLRATLGRVMRDVSKLVRLPTPDVPVEIGGKNVVALHNALSTDLDSVLLFSEQAAVENTMFRDARSFSPEFLEQLTAHIQALCLIATALLRRTKLEEWQRLAPEVQAAESAVRGVLAEYLENLALFIETGKELKRPNWGSTLETWNRATESVSDNDRPRLVNRLVSQTQRLV